VAQNFRCVYCDRDLLASIDDYDVWQFDHIVPVSQEGENKIENLAVACKLCNFAKRDFDPRLVAGDHASVEELRAIAKAHVTERRAEKRKRLDAVKDILFQHGLITPERFKRNVEPGIDQ
jgi:CRISPR/Cas system Type II protein with McrA/HNH and RuvC-like nuclease domain